MTMASSEAAREMSALGVRARREREAAVKRVLRAYRRVNYAHAGRTDVVLLERLADELEASAAGQLAAGA